MRSLRLHAEDYMEIHELLEILDIQPDKYVNTSIKTLSSEKLRDWRIAVSETLVFYVDVLTEFDRLLWSSILDEVLEELTILTEDAVCSLCSYVTGRCASCIVEWVGLTCCSESGSLYMNLEEAIDRYDPNGVFLTLQEIIKTLTELHDSLRILERRKQV